MWGQKMAIDPNNPNIVYVGTGANGLFVTTNGGNTWSSVSGVPTATSDGNGKYPGITGILFDPANTNIIFAASYGNGVYETTNGGTSWSKLSGGPGSVDTRGDFEQRNLLCDRRQQSSLDLCKRYLDGSSLVGIAGVAVDPFNPNHVVATQSDGQLNESFNSGSSWSGWSQYANRMSRTIFLGSGHLVAWERMA